MIVLNKPIGKLTDRISDSSSSLQNYMSMTFHGRNAVREFMAENNLSNCTVLVPSYICGSFVNYLKKIGVKIQYYNVKYLDQIDLPDIKQRLMAFNPRVVVLVHFFGLQIKNVTEVRKFLVSQGVLALEDYCHSFGSLWKDMKEEIVPEHSIVSFRKTLPLRFGGGYLKGSDKSLNTSLFNIMRARAEVSPAGLYIVERFSNVFSWPNIYSKRFQMLKTSVRKCLINGNTPPDDLVTLDLKSSKYISDEYIENSNLKRVNNYLYLSSLVKSHPDFTVELSLNVPQAFIIRDQTSSLCEYLTQRGIGAYKWPGEDITDTDVLNENFPDVIQLIKETTCVPIHQDLCNEEIQYMANAINSYYRSSQTRD